MLQQRGQRQVGTGESGSRMCLNSRLVSALVEQLNKLLEQAWRPELSVRHVSPGQRLPEELALELASLGMSDAPVQLVGVWVLRAGDSVKER